MKTVIITGTSAGIGYKLSQIFSDKKFKVISLSRSSNITEISSKNIEHFSFDITNKEIADLLNVKIQTTLLIFENNKEIYRSLVETTKELI